MHIQHNISLKKYNTFGVDVSAKQFVAVSNKSELEKLFDDSHSNFFILGGGSNILFRKDYDGLVIKNEILGIEIVEESDSAVIVKAGAGVVWHDLVLWAVENNYSGIENLSLIPGSVGAGPIQNIGAYGVELKDVFHSLEAFDIESKKIKSFNAGDCQFGYRNSIFKNELKNKVIITSVALKLSKKSQVNISYGSLKNYLEENKTGEVSIKTVSDAVIAIRSSKLPDPKELGNAGSFFKNPVISSKQFNLLKEVHANMVGYSVSETEVKVAAGWLIESCGWKGKRVGDTGSHAKQSLVLVNYDKASGDEVFKLSEEIIKSVKEKFNIELEREVNIL
ncbi:MAG: UDP-N-acetylmuramate dehydrogenase [Bacteroidia bacterium]|nr:UDP-N-acetylmuramate dehydrogenase [Bacteroidia bacterium]